MAEMYFERDDQKPRGGRVSSLRPPHYAPSGVKAFSGKAPATGFFLSDFTRSKLDWAWTCDARLCITRLSEGFTAMTGLLPAAFIGAPLEKLGAFSEGERAGQHFAQLAGGQGVTDARFALNCVKEPVDVLFSAVPIFNHDKELLGFEGGVVRPPQEPAQSVQDGESEKSKALDLAHHVQHELRTPLNAISGFAQIMREDLKGRADGRYAEYCDDILSASQHLLSLVDDLVAANGAEQKNLASPTFIDFSLATLLDEVGRLISPMMEGSDRALRIDPVNTDLVCTTDRRRLKQICLNLLENAVKFTPSGKALGLAVAFPEDGTLDLTVWDEGPGISADEQSLIWERFKKGGTPSQYTASSPGLGLGLSVVKSLADSIGAKVSLDSVEGRGSRFTVRLAQVY